MSDSQVKYILTERIAQGGMAEIHLGKSVGSDGFERICAFKRILPQYAADAEFVEMFRNEAKVAKQLQNKNIVQVYDFLGDGESYMLVMEFVDGADLRSVLGQSEKVKKRIPIEIACYIAIEALSGLGYAHTATDVTGRSMNIIHRDVSPQNILLSYDGDVKITDFGIAKASTGNGNTRTGVLKGKFSYMSPEQASGEDLDNRTDIFALGIVFYEMLTMTRLFKGEDIVVLNNVREGKIRRPNENKGTQIPAELEAICMKMLAKKASDRYVTCKEAIRDLTKFLYSFRPDFFGGELADFMELIFRERMESARNRVRSTLALPGGALGLGALKNAVAIDSRGQRLTRSSGEAKASSPFGPGGGGPPLGGPAPVMPPHSPGSSGGGGAAPGGALPFDMASLQNAPRLDVADAAPRSAHSGPGRGGGVQSPVSKHPYAKELTNLRRVAGASGSTRVGTTVRGSSPQNPRGAQGGSTPSSGGLVAAAVSVLVLGAGGVSSWRLGLLDRFMAAKAFEVELVTTPSGFVQLESEDGQRLFGGQFQRTPLRVRLDAQVKQLRVVKPGFRSEVVTLNPQAGVSREIIVFKREGAMGNLKLTTVPSRGKIVLENGQDVGDAPYTFENLLLGKTYEFRIQHPNCPVQMHKDVLPVTSDRGVIARTIHLKNCK